MSLYALYGLKLEANPAFRYKSAVKTSILYLKKRLLGSPFFFNKIGLFFLYGLFTSIWASGRCSVISGQCSEGRKQKAEGRKQWSVISGQKEEARIGITIKIVK